MSPFVWIIIDKSTDILLNKLRDVYIPYNCEFIIIKTINETYYKIEDYYNIGLSNNTQRQKHEIGFWSQDELTIVQAQKILRRFNMLKENIIIITPVLVSISSVSEISVWCQFK